MDLQAPGQIYTHSLHHTYTKPELQHDADIGWLVAPSGRKKKGVGGGKTRRNCVVMDVGILSTP
jgi:hypothetical protein